MGKNLNCPLCESASEFFYEKLDKNCGVMRYQRCPTCQLIFLQPECRLSRLEEKKRYDHHQNIPHDLEYQKFLARLIDPLKKLLAVNSKGLDYGCGPGPTIKHMLQKDALHVKNFDPVYYPDYELLNETYDFITCTEAIEHFFEPRKEIDRFEQLLTRPNGFLGIMTFVYQNPEDFETWWYHRDPTHVCFYHPDTFAWIAQWKNWQMSNPADNVYIFQT